MYTYTAYSLGIHSELPLPELVVAKSQPDVVVRLGQLDNLEKVVHDGGSCFLGEVANIGRFLIRGGSEIVFAPVPSVDEAVIRTTILGPILSVLLRQRGLLVLHASCIVVNGSAVAFMGASGWGKSTLAETLHLRGYSLVTDDVMGVQVGSGTPIVFPGYPQLKLWPDAAASLGHIPENLPQLNSQSDKRIHRVAHNFPQTPLPLKRIYVLGEGSQHAIVNLPHQKAFVELVRHSRAVSLLRNPDYISSHLRQCTSLVKNVSVCRLERPRLLAGLPDTVKLVEEDITQISDHDAENRYGFGTQPDSLSYVN